MITISAFHYCYFLLAFAMLTVTDFACHALPFYFRKKKFRQFEHLVRRMMNTDLRREVIIFVVCGEIRPVDLSIDSE